MIRNFEEYTKVQSFGNGITQWTDGYLNHSAKVVCIDDDKVTRNLVRSAFIADLSKFGNVFSKADASHLGLKY